MDDYENPRVARLRRHQSVDAATLAARAEHDRLLADLLVRLPSPPPRQDSLRDQLKDLWAIANRFGCYDAADFITRTIEGK